MESYLAALELDVLTRSLLEILEIVESYLAALELDVLTLKIVESYLARNIGKLFSCVRIRCIDAQLEIVESYLVALEIVLSYLALN